MKLNYVVPLVKTSILWNMETICYMSGGEFSSVTSSDSDMADFDEDSD